jgi:hypothetical protein
MRTANPTPGNAIDADDLDFARAFFGRVEARFTFAKTLPEHPHEYLVRSWLSPELRADFDRVCSLIVKRGYKGAFWHQTWVYLDVAEWRYWESRSFYGNGGPILNRARNETARDRASPGLDRAGTAD